MVGAKIFLVEREVELRNLMTELNLPARTITELVQRHFGFDRRIGALLRRTKADKVRA